jgi:hypothetical protein
MLICQGCGQRLAIPEGYERRKLRCPQCGVYCDTPTPTKKEAPPPRPPARTAPPAEPPPRPVKEAAPRKPPPVRTPAPAAKARPAARPVRPPMETSHEDDGKPYAVDGPDEVYCPECQRVLVADTVLCTACGYNLETGEKVAKTYTAIDREWNSGLALGTRLAIFFACNLFVLAMGGIGSQRIGSPLAFLGPWLLFTGLFSFIMGTFDRVRVTRDRRGRAELTKTWRVCFIPRPTVTIPYGEYDGVATGAEANTGLWDWLIVIILASYGGFPGLLWWFFVIRPDTFYVALTKYHGAPELKLHRSQDQHLAREIAETIRDATGLPYDPSR